MANVTNDFNFAGYDTSTDSLWTATDTFDFTTTNSEVSWLPESCEREKYSPIWHMVESYTPHKKPEIEKKHWWKFWK